MDAFVDIEIDLAQLEGDEFGLTPPIFIDSGIFTNFDYFNHDNFVGPEDDNGDDDDEEVDEIIVTGTIIRPIQTSSSFDFDSYFAGALEGLFNINLAELELDEFWSNQPCSLIPGFDDLQNNADDLKDVEPPAPGDSRIAGGAPYAPFVNDLQQEMRNSEGEIVSPDGFDSDGRPYWDGPDTNGDGVPDTLEGGNFYQQWTDGQGNDRSFFRHSHECSGFV